MLRKILMYCSSLFFIFVSNANHAYQPTTIKQRNLAILLDFDYQDSNRHDSPLSDALFDLLHSKNSYILINESVWYSLGNRIQKDKVDCSFFYRDWHIYKKDHFLLLVPKEHAQSLEPERLGLHLELLQPAQLNFTPNSFLKKLQNDGTRLFHHFFPQLLGIRSHEFIMFLKDILVAREKAPSLAWNIFFIGHGSVEDQTVGISQESMIAFIDLLENHITTHALCYETCFGGYVQDYVFKDKRYSFPIFCVGISDAATFATPSNWHTFFKYMSTIDIQNPKTCYNFARIAFELYGYRSNNIISMRLTHNASFIIPSIPNVLCLLSQHNHDKDYRGFMHLILDTPILEPTLSIIDIPITPSKPLSPKEKYYTHPSIVCASKGPYNYHIHEITTNVPYEELLCSFYDTCDIASQKHILIDSIHCCDKQDNALDTLQNIIISRAPQISIPHEDWVFFIKNNQGYCLDICTYEDDVGVIAVSSTLRTLSAQETQEKLNLFSTMKESIKQGKQPKDITLDLEQSPGVFSSTLTRIALAFVTVECLRTYIASTAQDNMRYKLLDIALRLSFLTYLVTNTTSLLTGQQGQTTTKY